MEELAVNEVENILPFPDKVFEEIFSYTDIKTRRNLGPVCKDFYRILCRMERDKHPLEITDREIFEDDKTFESVIHSKREFCDLIINVEGDLAKDYDRLLELVRKFGLRIKKIKIRSDDDESVILCDEQLIDILKCVPSIEELILQNAWVPNYFTLSCMQQQEPNLFKLKRLVIESCALDESVFLNNLPADILTELAWFNTEPNRKTNFQDFFNRQKNIKKLKLIKAAPIALDHLKLEHLEIDSKMNYSIMVGQQQNLKHLDISTEIDDDAFSSVCKLGRLEVLGVDIRLVSVNAFRSLANISGLKELRLDTSNSDHLHELSVIRFDELEKLALRYSDDRLMIPQEIVIGISMNFPRLKELEISNLSIDLLTVILQLFPRLESIVYNFQAIPGVPVVYANLRHENLKQIVLEFNFSRRTAGNFRALLKVLNACPNLEKIQLSDNFPTALSEFTVEDFRSIIEQHQNLTHLSLAVHSLSFDSEVVHVIKSSTKLVHLRLKGLITLPMLMSPLLMSPLSLQATFEEKFAIIRTRELEDNCCEIVMKKRNTADWNKNCRVKEQVYE